MPAGASRFPSAVHLLLAITVATVGSSLAGWLSIRRCTTA